MAAEPPLIKICGITRPEDAAACAALEVWAVGLVFAEGSSRRVDAETAALADVIREHHSHLEMLAAHDAGLAAHCAH